MFLLIVTTNNNYYYDTDEPSPSIKQKISFIKDKLKKDPHDHSDNNMLVSIRTPLQGSITGSAIIRGNVMIIVECFSNSSPF